MNYKNCFKHALKEDVGDMTTAPNPTPTPAPAPSDADIWKNANPDIAGNEELNAKFDVEGLSRPEIEKYSNIIGGWKQGIDQAIKKLGEMLKFAATERLQDAPGSEQFSDLIKDVPNLKKELSAFHSSVEDLEQTVKLAISDASRDRKQKIRDLSQ